VVGLTKKGLSDLLDSKLKDTLLTNPYYAIRFLNFKVSVLGEVARPGLYNIPTERLNIFEAVGLAGDITPYGRRDNVLIIRESDGKRELTRLNLSDPMVFTSPYYFLKQNDIISVESNKYKNRQQEDVTLKYISIGASIISTAAIVISVLRR
jgi:polysaccharide export outer membrane protein